MYKSNGLFNDIPCTTRFSGFICKKKAAGKGSFHARKHIGKISDYQPEGPGFIPRPGRGLNFGRPSFSTPSVDRDVKPLV